MLIGQPNKIADFTPFTDEELAGIRVPIETALRDGAGPNVGVGVELGVVAKFIATIDALKASAVNVAPERPKLIIPGDGY